MAAKRAFENPGDRQGRRDRRNRQISGEFAAQLSSEQRRNHRRRAAHRLENWPLRRPRSDTGSQSLPRYDRRQKRAVVDHQDHSDEGRLASIITKRSGTAVAVQCRTIGCSTQTGKLLMEYSERLITVEVPNSPLKRFIGYKPSERLC